MKLYIGTANFLKRYGYKKKIVRKNNLIEINNCLKKNNLLNFDTSFLYDDFIHSNNFLIRNKLNISTKIFFKDVDFLKKKFEQKFIDLVKQKITQANISNFETILIHNYEDIKIQNLFLLFRLMNSFKRLGLTKKIGISIYNPKSIINLNKGYKIDVIQAPLNIIDRRFADVKIVNLLKKKNIKFQARSIFLQGLLLEKEKKLKNASGKKNTFTGFFNMCKKKNVSSYEACVNFIKDQKFIDSLVIGIENVEQLKEFIAIFFSKQKKIYPKEVFTYNSNIIDPRRW